MMFLLIPNKASSSVPRVYLIIAEPENREQKTFRSWPLAVNASEIRCAFCAWEVELAEKEGEKTTASVLRKRKPFGWKHPRRIIDIDNNDNDYGWHLFNRRGKQ